MQTRAGSPAGLRTLDDGSGGGQTEVGAVVGTPRYMSPEQAQGRTELLGPRSDQCALGLILFELVALVPAVPGTTAYEMLVAAAHGRRAPLQHWRTGKPVPRPLRAIIERATALHPEQRYQSVRALADDLRRYLRGDAVQAIPDSAWQKALRYVGRHRQQVLFALVGLVAIAALGFALLLQRHEQALLQQQARAAHLRALVDDVGAHGDELQLRLLRLQGELDALATAAAQLLLHGNPAADARMFWSGQFEDPAARPPDFAPQPGFAVPVSLAHGVWAHPPSVDRADAGLQLQARRLHALLPLRNALYAEARAVLGDGSGDGGVSAFVLALPSGLSVRYPGRVIAADAHDARSTPWYREAIDSPGVHWGAPYAEAGSGRLLLPLSEPLRNPGGGALGVASIELSLEYLVHNLLGGADASDGVTLLLDAAGRVIASEQVLRNGEGGAGTLQAFAEPALLAALQHADSGVVESNAFGRAELIAFDRIHPLEWVLVTRFDDGAGRGQGVGRE